MKISPSLDWLEEFQLKESIKRCLQCKKCTAGCTMSFSMEILPHQVIRYIQYGLQKELLQSNTAWICTGCRICGSRCPNKIDIADILDDIKDFARCKMYERASASKDIEDFHQLFIASVKNYGRVFEAEMLLKYKIKSGKIAEDVGLGLALFRKGKISLLPERVKQKGEIAQIFLNAKEKN